MSPFQAFSERFLFNTLAEGRECRRVFNGHLPHQTSSENTMRWVAVRRESTTWTDVRPSPLISAIWFKCCIYIFSHRIIFYKWSAFVSVHLKHYICFQCRYENCVIWRGRRCLFALTLCLTPLCFGISILQLCYERKKCAVKSESRNCKIL